MEIKEIILDNKYTCQHCSRVFKRNKEERIEIGVWPVCSNLCEFRVIYRFIKTSGLSNCDLEFMLKIVKNKEEINDFNKNKAIFEITKWYAKKGLANIKLLRDKRQGQKNRDKRSDREDKGQENPPYVIGGLSLSLSKLLGNPNIVPCPSFENDGGLNKWF